MRVGDKVRVTCNLGAGFAGTSREGVLKAINDRPSSHAEFTHLVKLDDGTILPLYFRPEELEVIEPPTTKTFATAITLSLAEVEHAADPDIIVEAKLESVCHDLRDSIYEWVEQVRPEPDPLDVLNEARGELLEAIRKAWEVGLSISDHQRVVGLVCAYGAAAVTLGKAEASS